MRAIPTIEDTNVRRVESAARRVSVERAETWTGRAATSAATDSHLPLIVSAGTHKTRVSEMRDVTPRAARPSTNGASGRPGHNLSMRSGSLRRSPIGD
jgi:hypothetical protein